METEKLHIKVTKMTADALREVAEAAGIPLGEVVNRYVLRMAPDDPNTAFVLIIEHYMTCVARLSKLDYAKVYGDMCGVLLGSIPPEELDSMVALIKKKRNENPEAEPFTGEELTAFREAVDAMTERAKSEYIRGVFYNLLHG